MKLYQMKTPALVIKVICQSLIQYYMGVRVYTTISSAHEFIQSQTKIGWDNFIRGRVASNLTAFVQAAIQKNKPYNQFTIDNWKNIFAYF